jgi:hypothetical protein
LEAHLHCVNEPQLPGAVAVGGEQQSEESSQRANRIVQGGADNVRDALLLPPPFGNKRAE